MKLMPKPFGLAVEFAKPFVLIIGGCALLLAVMCLVAGQDPTVPVDRFLSGSVDALLPFAVFLSILLLYYLTVYQMVGAYVCDLWTVARVPDWFVRFLRRRCFFSQQYSTLPVHLIPPFSPVHLHLPHLPCLQMMGWRAGDSAQLE